jgi:flotillin
MLEHLDKLAEASAKAISNIKFDKVVVWEGGGNGTGTSNTSAFLQSLARSLPPMLQVMKDVGGVEVPEFVAKLSGDGPTPTPTPPAAAHSANGTAPAAAVT